MSSEKMAALADFRNSPLFSDDEILVLELTEAMTATPAEVPAALREQLEERFSKGQFLELCASIAWENHRARLNRALGVKEMGFSDGAFCALPETKLSSATPCSSLAGEDHKLNSAQS